MIRATGLRKAYGRKEAVRGVDLDVRPGTLYGPLPLPPAALSAGLAKLKRPEWEM